MYAIDPNTSQESALPTPNAPLSTLQIFEYGSADRPVDMTQDQSQTSSTVTHTSDTEDTVTKIGSVLNNGKFACDYEECVGRTFTRQAELRRHHTTLHAANKPRYWCWAPTCRRSMGRGGKAFPRKDKLMAHVRSMHGGAR